MLKFIRKINKVSSHSYSLVLPKEIISKYGWRERQKLIVEDLGRGRLIIKDWKK